jgi:hypothetical protein
MGWLETVQKQNEEALELIKRGECEGYTVVVLPNGMEQILASPKGSARKFIQSILEEEMGHLWVCTACLMKEGVDPDKVTESCIGRFGKCTCHFCGSTQDGSWFRHILPIDLPPGLQEKLEQGDE